MSLINHLQAIEDSLNELAELSPNLAAPASLQNQYIGTCVDNTLVLLTGVANSIDGGGRHVRFSTEHNWRSAMQAVHRSFYTSVVSCVEKGCSELCAARGTGIVSERLRDAQKICNMLDALGGAESRTRIEKKILALAGSKPIFSDYISATIKSSDLTNERAKIWKRYFAALNIIRNKSSHSNPDLTEREADTLRAGGFTNQVSNTDELRTNPRNYKQICEHVILFFKEVGASIETNQSSS